MQKGLIIIWPLLVRRVFRFSDTKSSKASGRFGSKQGGYHKKIALKISDLEVQVKRKDNRIKELEEQLKQSQDFAKKESERATNTEAIIEELKIEQKILIESLVENDGLVTNIKRMQSSNNRFYRHVRESYNLLIDMLLRREIRLVDMGYNLKTSVRNSKDDELAAVIMSNLTMVIEQLLEFLREQQALSPHVGKYPVWEEKKSPVELRSLSSPEVAAKTPLPKKLVVDHRAQSPTIAMLNTGRESPVEKDLKERVEKYKRMKLQKLREAQYGSAPSNRAKLKSKNWYRW